MKQIILFLTVFVSCNLVYSTPDFQPHERLILLGCNDNSMFYLKYSSCMTSTYSAYVRTYVIEQSLTEGKIKTEILIRDTEFSADSETKQLEWTKKEKKIKEFNLNTYLIENKVNMMFNDNLEYIHIIDINRQGIKITRKGNENPLFLGIEKLQIYVPWINRALDWKDKFHDKFEWNYGEVRVVESFTSGNYLILKVETGENHPESLFQQSFIVIDKNNK